MSLRSYERLKLDKTPSPGRNTNYRIHQCYQREYLYIGNMMPFIGELSALSAATLWAGSSMIIAALSSKIGPVQTNIGRMVVSMIFFVSTILLFKLPLALSSTQVWYLVLSAIVGIVFGDSFLFKAFQQIGARISMLIMALAPAIATLLAYIFLGEAPPRWGIIGIFLTLGGVALVVFERREPMSSRYTITKFGIMCGFLGALGQGGGIIFVKLAFLEGPIHGVVAAFIRISVAVMFLLPATALMQQHFRNPFPILRSNKRIAAYLLVTAFFGTYLGITLSLIAVAHTEVGVASTLIATSPVLMLPMVKIVYKETLSWKAVAGAFVAVSGVAILFLT